MSGILAGALGGLGKGVSEIAGGHIQNQQKMDLVRETEALAEQREMRRLEWQQRVEGNRSAARARTLSEAPEGLSGTERARWLQQRGLGDDAKFELDATKADTKAETDAERLRLTGERDVANLATAQARLEAQQARGAAGGSEQGSNFREIQAANELRARYEKAEIGGLVLNPDKMEEYEQAFQIMNDLLEEGMSPARAVDEAQRRARRGTTTSGDGPDSGATRITSREQYEQLPSGARFVAPDGSVRVKP